MDKKSLELGKSLLICYLSMCILLSHFCTLITINLSESWYLFIGTVLCSLIASIKSYQLLALQQMCYLLICLAANIIGKTPRPFLIVFLINYNR